MGLDISLIFDVDTGGVPHWAVVFEAAITHNLVDMAKRAGIYESVWQPNENGIKHAKQLIEPLEKGYEILKANPENFRHLAPENGFGTYEVLVDFVKKYIRACKDYPKAEIRVWL